MLAFPSRKQTIFVGVKLSLLGHGNSSNIYYFYCFVLKSDQIFCVLFSLLTISLCVWPAGLRHMADNVHGGHLPCVWAWAHKQTPVLWMFLCIQQKYNLAAVIKLHRNNWQLQAKRKQKKKTQPRANTMNHRRDYTLKKWFWADKYLVARAGGSVVVT